MSHILPVLFSQGYVSTGGVGRSSYDLEAGELVEMSGAYYRKNDPSSLWKIPGRSLFGSAGSGAVNGVAICQFDEGGTDRLIAAVATKVVSASLGTTGTFTDLITGLDADATRLTACHQNDRHFIGNGYDKNKKLLPDGTVKDMGLTGPHQMLTCVVGSSSGAEAYPVSETGDFDNPLNAIDSNDGTFASGTRSSRGSVTQTWYGWPSNSTANRAIKYRWFLAGLPPSGEGPGGTEGSIGTGGTIDSGYLVTVKFELSEDDGVTWTTLQQTSHTSSTPSVAWANSEVLVANSNLVRFKATLTYNEGTGSATLAVYAVKEKYGSTTPVFSTTTGIYYAYTEYDSTETNPSGDFVQSAPSPISDIVVLTNENQVSITRPAQINTDATHWRLYRIVDGGSKTHSQLGKLDDIPIASTTYLDTFDIAAFDEVLSETVPALTIGDLWFPRDSQPPAFISMVSWKGSICGISRTNRRSWRYSESAYPESFPEVYVVTSFPLDEHDGLVGQMAVGETMVLLCEGAVVALDDVPRVVDGQFNGADARPLKGHPGCVGNYAYTTYSVAGEPRGAWVSPFGVYITNGQSCSCISTDMSWESEVNESTLNSAVLRWDQKNLILWFEFDSNGDGLNDREMPFHMAPFHAKGESRPKLGQPTAKSTSCMAAALIGTRHYRFSGHPSDGGVYIEETTTTGVTMSVRTGKIDQGRTDMGIIKASVVHADSGSGETAILTTTTYRDDARISTSRTNEVSLSGNSKTTVFIGRAGEAVDLGLVYDGDGNGGILGVQLELDGQGRSGSGNRWVSASATP